MCEINEIDVTLETWNNLFYDDPDSNEYPKNGEPVLIAWRLRSQSDDFTNRNNATGSWRYTVASYGWKMWLDDSGNILYPTFWRYITPPSK